jgi:hypothetical protein
MSVDFAMLERCPLHPQDRLRSGHSEMAEECQFQTNALQQTASLFSFDPRRVDHTRGTHMPDGGDVHSIKANTNLRH